MLAGCPGRVGRRRARPTRVASVVLLCVALAGCAASPRLGETQRAAFLPAAVELAQVPFYPQTDQQCGPAAVATVLGAAGRDVSLDALSRELYLPQRQGSLQPEIVASIRARGLVPYPLDPSLEALLTEVAAGRAVLLLQKQGLGPWPAWHYAVVVGYDVARDMLVLRSGTRERLELRTAVLETTWDRADRWAIVALEPDVLPARPDLQRYVAAAAGLEATGQVEPARRAYETAAQAWPQAALPRLGLANLAAGRGDWEVAERGYADVLRIEPGNAAAINNRAEAIARLGCPATALRWLTAAAKPIEVDDPLRPALENTLAGLAVRPAAPEPADCGRFAPQP
jgi:tetratricopeptide (TPR) repeat protein